MLVYINLLVESVCFAQSETQIYSDTTLISSVLCYGSGVQMF